MYWLLEKTTVLLLSVPQLELTNITLTDFIAINNGDISILNMAKNFIYGVYLITAHVILINNSRR